jgi:DNA-binding GntR family transcriptional regulator
MQDTYREIAGVRNLGGRGTLKDEAIQVVRRALMAGDMKPGLIYSANSLAPQLGVSNSPVREAMMELASKGLLEVVKNRGFRVVEVTDKDRQEIYDLRMLVEVPSVLRVAKKGLTEDQVLEIERLADDTLAQARPDNMLVYLDADQSFHMAIIGILDNERLTAIVENLRDQSRVRGSYQLAERGLLRKSAEEHLPIVRALIAGDIELLEKLLIEHLDYARPH